MDKIPSTMYTLVLANFRDLDPKSFLIPTFHIKQYCFSKGGNFSFLESSMKNCYGLTGVKTFLSLPFLKVREKFLKSLVEKNKEEIDTARYEVDYLIENLKYEKMNNTSTDEDTVKPESNPIQKNPEEIKNKLTNSDNKITKKPETVENKLTKSNPSQNKENKAGGNFFSNFIDSIKNTFQPNQEEEQDDEVVDTLKQLAEDSKLGKIEKFDFNSFVPEGDLESFFTDDIPIEVVIHFN